MIKYIWSGIVGYPPLALLSLRNLLFLCLLSHPLSDSLHNAGEYNFCFARLSVSFPASALIVPPSFTFSLMLFHDWSTILLRGFIPSHPLSQFSFFGFPFIRQVFI